MIGNQDSFIALVTQTSLDIEQIKIWFNCVKNNAPSGLTRTVQTTDDHGTLRSVSLYSEKSKGTIKYIIPLVRNLSESEGEKIILNCCLDIDFDIELSTSYEEMPSDNVISVDDEKYLQICSALAKRKHENWMNSRLKGGWTYGTSVNMEAKTHPLLRPWDQLPSEHKEIDLDAPQMMLDLLDSEGYAIVGKDEVAAIKSMLARKINESVNKKYITEAPIENFELLGDFNKSSSFRHEQDRKLLTNPKAVAKIKMKWSKTDVPFNMYFVNSAEANRHTEVGMVDRAWLEKNMPKTLPLIDIKSNCINILYTNNKGDEREPMTSWVLSHRFGHVVSRYGSGGRRQIEEFTEARNSLLRISSMILENYGIRDVPTDDRNYQSLAKSEKALLWFFQTIGTMKSARDKNIRNSYEFLLELLSQYLLTSGIKFNPLPKSFKISGRMVFFRGTDHDFSYYSGALDDLAEELTYIFENLLSRCIGRTFVM